MKNLYKTILAGILLVTASCNDDFLDRYPLDQVSNGSYWKTEAHLSAASNYCYGAFAKDWLNTGEGCGELMIYGNATSGLNTISAGRHQYDIGFPVTTWWTGPYAYIYQCNNFLANYNKADIPVAVKENYAAQVRVIRAYCYYLLTSLFGDVTLVTTPEAPSSGIFKGGRTPKADVVNFIYRELNECFPKLSQELQVLKNAGKINRWGALALKARVALQNENWEMAASAADSVMRLSPHALWGNYRTLFLVNSNTKFTDANKETMLVAIYAQNIRMHNMHGEVLKPVDYTRWNPTRALVDMYLCTDGKAATKGFEYKNSTGIQLSPLYNVDTYEDYWKNRDPRMDMTICKPGDAWWGGDDGDADNAVNTIYNIPRFKNDIIGANCRLGFYAKKYSQGDAPNPAADYNKDYNDIHILRYGDVLLMYAEAKERLGTLTQDDLDRSINLLRDRVGMHHMVLSELTAWGMDVRKEIRRERAVELVLEGQRYLDILRYKGDEGYRLGASILTLDKKVLDKFKKDDPTYTHPFTKYEVVPNDRDANKNDTIYVYDASVASGGTRTFDPTKHYIWPIPNTELRLNPNLGQNTGWAP